MKEKTILNLSFLTSSNTSTKITINKPVLNASAQTINAIMEQVISHGTLEGVIEKKSAEYVTSSTESISI